MPNKNIKKRRRVVMTSDVVPSGSREREEASAPEVKTDEVATTETSVDSAAASRDADVADAPVASDPDDSNNDEVTVPSAPMQPALFDDARASDEPSAPNDATATDEASAADEVTDPAAKGEELWTPEESEPPAVTVPAADLSRAHLKGLIEALVFVADQPVALNDIAKAAGRADRKLVKALADELRQDYARRGIHLDEVAGGLIFRTNPAYAPFIRDVAAKKPVRMTRAQLETLSIVAYRQPLTRPEVDEVRGVDSGPVMKMLLERDLIKILGKKDEPGRPLLYGTTHTFLEFFGLKALKDLPSLREFTELNDDSRRVYDREMGDSPDAPTEPDLATLAAAASVAGAGARANAEVSADASADAEASSDADPATMRPGESSVGAWFDRPTEPDTTVEALEPTLEADLQGSDEREFHDNGATAVESESESESDESDIQN
jgi:segregation and condensation protein B